MENNKMQFSKILWIVFAILALGIIAALLVPVRWINQNDVKTGLSLAYPDILPRFYEEQPDETFDAALEALAEIPRVTIEEELPSGHRIVATKKTRILKFTDDIEITIHAGYKGSVVNIQSRSRVGQGDFGQNARNIREIQSAMDSKLTLSQSAN